MSKNRGPCSYKQQCISCKLVPIESRPSLCESMQCEHFTPCVSCSDNKKLINNTCSRCKRLHQQDRDRRDQLRVSDIEDEIPEDSLDTEVDSKYDSIPIPEYKGTLALPGTPPESFSPAEKDYYLMMWSKYDNYYRNPTAYPIAHAIIIQQMELNRLIQQIHEASGEYVASLEQKKNKTIESLKKLHDQMPDREAEEISDDEKSIAMIYDSYIEAKKKRHQHGVSRILSPDAVALAPKMTHKIDVENLLVRLGYNIIEIEEVLAGLNPDEYDKDSTTTDEALEFFGIHLNRKYAISGKRDEVEDGIE